MTVTVDTQVIAISCPTRSANTYFLFKIHFFTNTDPSTHPELNGYPSLWKDFWLVNQQTKSSWNCWRNSWLLTTWRWPKWWWTLLLVVMSMSRGVGTRKKCCPANSCFKRSWRIGDYVVLCDRISKCKKPYANVRNPKKSKRTLNEVIKTINFWMQQTRTRGLHAARWMFQIIERADGAVGTYSHHADVRLSVAVRAWNCAVRLPGDHLNNYLNIA